MAFVAPCPLRSFSPVALTPARVSMCAAQIQKPEVCGAGMARVVAANEASVAALGCRAWPIWTCEASKFPWKCMPSSCSLSAAYTTLVRTAPLTLTLEFVARSFVLDDDDEVCFLLKGAVVVTDKATGKTMEVKAGDIAMFPKDMECTWDVSEAIEKHYDFGYVSDTA